jgi:hypothetical protein
MLLASGKVNTFLCALALCTLLTGKAVVAGLIRCRPKPYAQTLLAP